MTMSHFLKYPQTDYFPLTTLETNEEKSITDPDLAQ